MTTTVIIRHNFESAHRLPALGGKCVSLHGHSWNAEVEVTGEVDQSGVLIDFGLLKRQVRGWIDDQLDHGAMLGVADPLLPALKAERCKVFIFGETDRSTDLYWPTVENVAELIRREVVAMIEGTGARVHRVRVDETATNSSTVVAGS